jgi:hypothetical protein
MKWRNSDRPNFEISEYMFNRWPIQSEGMKGMDMTKCKDMNAW